MCAFKRDIGLVLSLFLFPGCHELAFSAGYFYDDVLPYHRLKSTGVQVCMRVSVCTWRSKVGSVNHPQSFSHPVQ